jgi:hypothetical protein
MSFSGTSAGKRLQEPTAGTTVKAKTHFFRNLDLTSVLDPSFDDGVFTGALTFHGCPMGHPSPNRVMIRRHRVNDRLIIQEFILYPPRNHLSCSLILYFSL